MNLLDLDDLSRETFILNLPDVSDIIILERTNRELRDWITHHDIYRKWERKHFGKTDKWRILLLQELGVKQCQRFKFLHTASKISVAIQTVTDDDSGIEETWSYLGIRQRSPEFQSIFVSLIQKYGHFFQKNVKASIREANNNIGSGQFHILLGHFTLNEQNSVKLYNFMYSLLAFGLEYTVEGDNNVRFVRGQITPTHQCSNCFEEFCGIDETSEEWRKHRCE